MNSSLSARTKWRKKKRTGWDVTKVEDEKMQYTRKKAKKEIGSTRNEKV